MNAVEAAIEYRARGLYTVPVAQGEKGCHREGWQHERLSVEDIPGRFKADDNLLVILGIDNLVDVDLDSAEAIRAARFFLPDTGFRWGRASKPCSHGLYRLDRAIPSKSYLNPVPIPAPTLDNPDKVKHETVAEFRCLKGDGTIGKGTILPPGVHQTGEDIRLETDADGSIASVEADTLFTAVRRTAAAALIAKYWPLYGSGGHRFEIALAGALAHGGLDQDIAETFVLAAYQTREKFDASLLRTVQRGVADTYAKHSKDEAVTGFAAMCSLVPPSAAPAISTALDWLGCTSDGVAWETPLRIDSLKAVRPLDPAILPPLMAEYCADIAKAMVVPVEVPVASLIVGASIAIGNRAALQPKALETKWLQVPNLWGVVIGEPGSTKSAAMTTALAPLFEIDKEIQKQSDADKSEYAKRMEEHRLKVSVYKSRLKKIMKSDDPEVQRPESPIPPQKPVYRQIVIHESTPEKLHEKCTDNPNGLFCFADELATWFASMEKKGHETERGLWLKGWTGDQSHCISTISRGDVFVDKLCLSVLGSTQPQKWRNYVQEVVKGNGNDGLLQRLQLMIWPDEAPQMYVDIPRNDALIARVKERFRALLALGTSAEMPVVYRFTPDAQQVFEAWWNRMAAKREASNKPEAVESHYAKYKSLMPSLALIFQLFDDMPRLFEGGNEGEPEVRAVDATNAERAVQFCSWLVPHVERCYGCMGTSVGVEVLCSRIKDGSLGESFTCYDVLRKEWRGLREKQEALNALARLRDALWVRYNGSKRRYYVNPKLKAL